MQEAYFRYMAENPTAGLTQEEEEENIDYDSDGNPIAPTKKIIMPLPPIDHSEVRTQAVSISVGPPVCLEIQISQHPATRCRGVAHACTVMCFLCRLIILPLRRTSMRSTRSSTVSQEHRWWSSDRNSISG